MQPEVFDPTKESEKADKLFTQEATETLEMGNEELVQKIFRVSMNTLRTGDGYTRVGYTVANFAALLTNLSRQAEESTKKMVRLTYWICGLTIILLFVTIGQLVVAFKATKKPVIIYLKSNEENKQTTQRDNTNQVHTDNKFKSDIHPAPTSKNEIHK